MLDRSMEHSKDLIKKIPDVRSPLTLCPVKIPKTGKKLFTYKGVTLFFRTIKGILQVYEAEHEFLICVSVHDRAKTMEYIVKGWKRVETEIDSRRAEKV